MKRYTILYLLIVGMAFSCQQKDTSAVEEDTQQSTIEKKKPVSLPRFPSPAASVQQNVGMATIKIDYSRPSVISSEGIDRTGKIWGELVPYDFNFRTATSQGRPIPWRAGANENTIIDFSHDAIVEGFPINAGKYGLHMAIHEKEGAMIIFSNNANDWGSFSYDEKDDALRVEVKTKIISQTERLLYSFPQVDKVFAIVALDWEKKRIPFKVEFDVHDIMLGNFRDHLSDTTGLIWKDYNQAANYCANNNINFEEGMRWVEQSISIEENYTNLSTKSVLLSIQGNEVEAEKIKNAALENASATADDYYSYGTALIRMKKPDKAMEIYQRLSKRWPDDWLTAHGLARGYSAKGDYKTALKYEIDALAKAPERNKGFIENALVKLKQGKGIGDTE
jgi:tetratricopeptide (TPR) repeat protein